MSLAQIVDVVLLFFACSMDMDGVAGSTTSPHVFVPLGVLEGGCLGRGWLLFSHWTP